MTSDVEDGELLSSDDENNVESERSDCRTLKEEFNHNNKSDRNYQLYENQALSNHDRKSNTQKINSNNIDNKEIINKKIKHSNENNNFAESKESNPYKRKLNTNYLTSINGNEVFSKRQRITDENNYPVKNEVIENKMNHDDSSLEKYKKSRLCKYYSANECKNGANCAYMHEQFPCKFFHYANATCYSGNNCRYSHAPLTDETKAILESFLNDNKSIKCEEITSVPNKTSERPRCLLPTPPESQSQTQLLNPPIQSDCNNVENPILPKIPHKSRFSDRQVVRPVIYAPVPAAVSTFKPINFPPPKSVPMVNSIGQPLQRFQPDITQPPPIVLPNDNVIKSEPTTVRLPGQPIPSQAAIKSLKKPLVKSSISKNVQIQEAIKKLADKISIKSTQPVAVSKPNEIVTNSSNNSSFFPPVSNNFYNESGSNEWQPLERQYISITAKDLEEASSPKRYTFEINEPEYTSEGDWTTPESLDLPISKCYDEIFINVDNLHVNPLCDPRFTKNEVLDRLDNTFDNDLYYGFLKIRKTNESIKSN